MVVPHDYAERVYAGVLGKIIGVYLGRPIEGWTYEQVSATFGEIAYYVHDRSVDNRQNRHLVVTDDDISGTFTFLRALPDHGNTDDLTSEQIGQTWLNYIMEGRTILWWGGLGNSTEHTAYVRLKQGIPAPRSGSHALNGNVIAEQIGAQIFIDGWAMVAPGDPELAATLAGRAARVSHDGEAVYGAQVIAAMEAHAFVESNLNALIDTAVGFIPRDSTIYRLIQDIREWHVREPRDWRATRRRIVQHYGYDRYGGNCHIVPNHALIIHSLLYGDDDFQQSLMIVNTSGWDTDCNSGNVGCLLGLKNGLAAIDAGPDWRGPVADRLYLATADGGRGITDAVTETYHVVNVGRALAGEAPQAPKSGARFHFELPGSIQGFQTDEGSVSKGTVTLENVQGHSRLGRRSLALHYRYLARGCVGRVKTPTFIPPEAIEMPAYELLASPTLYPGQVLTARVEADAANHGPVTCGLFLEHYGPDDTLVVVEGPTANLSPGMRHEFMWRIPSLDGQPIAAIGLELRSDIRADGTIYVDYLTWEGAPDVALGRPTEGGTMWRRAWIDAVDQWESRWPQAYRPVQNHGTGLLIQGTREWTDYRVTASITPYVAQDAGIGVRVQGLHRYYAVLLRDDGTVRMVKKLDREIVLAQATINWVLEDTYKISLQVKGTRLWAWIDDRLLFEVEDTNCPLLGGGVALIVSDGSIGADAVVVRPVS